MVNVNRVNEQLVVLKMSVGRETACQYHLCISPPSQQKGSKERRILGQAAECGKCLAQYGSHCAWW